MILADKIIRLRKQFNFSQEELAEKLNVSRQSVSKWESANSIPDLNKILKLAQLFGVTTDYLLKDEIEETETLNEDNEPNTLKVTLDEAMDYIDKKVTSSKTISIGVLFTILSFMPLVFLLYVPNISQNIAVSIGLVALFIMIAIGVVFFIRSSRYSDFFIKYEDQEIELVYGVRSILKEHLSKYRKTYTLMISIGVILFILSPTPLILASILNELPKNIILMLIVMLLMIACGISIIVPASTKYNSLSLLLAEGVYSPSRKKSTKKAEKIASIYWPLITAIYLGWSFWKMAWGITWIIWPVAAVLFAAVLGLANLKEDK